MEVDKGLKGKIVEKVVYEKNKHIFPYKNWKIVSKHTSFTDCVIVRSHFRLC